MDAGRSLNDDLSNVLEFRILGPLDVRANGEPVDLGGTKQRALLELLLLHANETVPRDRLIDELWGDQPPETAAYIVQGHVWHLRKTLGRDAIGTHSSGYRLSVLDGQLDLARFERLVDEARGEVPTLRPNAFVRRSCCGAGPHSRSSKGRSGARSELASTRNISSRSSAGSMPISSSPARRSSFPSWRAWSAGTHSASAFAVS